MIHPSWFRHARTLALFAAAGGAALIAVVLILCAVRALSVDVTEADYRKVRTQFYDTKGRELGTLRSEARDLLPAGPLPEKMVQAILAAEDRRFYSHLGIDPVAVGRALAANFASGKRSQGGSTITQQLAKHLLGDFRKTYTRKATEAIVALRLEFAYSKEQLLRSYLNRIYLGGNEYGVETAAREYFGKPSHELTHAEAALLAAMTKGPNSYCPRRHPERAKARRDFVLNAMRELNMIDEATRAEACATPIRVKPAEDTRAGSYPLDFARAHLPEVMEAADTGWFSQPLNGLNVDTTIDLDWQQQAETVATDALRSLGDAEDEARLQVAVVLAEPDTGAIRALVGGRHYLTSAFNRATQAVRDVDQLVLPFAYVLGLTEAGLSPASLVHTGFLDARRTDPGDYYTLGDWRHDTGRQFSLYQDALGDLNRAAAVRIVRRLTPGRVSSWFAQSPLGRPVSLPQDDAAMETVAASLLELASLYQGLANGGAARPLTILERVKDHSGALIYDAAEGAQNPPARRWLDPAAARQFNFTFLQATRGNRDPSDPPFVAAGDVSQGSRDEWFIGYSDRLVAGVWVGRDDGAPLSAAALRGRAARRIGLELMRRFHQEHPPRLWQPRENDDLIALEADPATGGIIGPAVSSPAPGREIVYLTRSQLANADETRQPAQTLKLTSYWLDRLASFAPATPRLPREPADRRRSERPSPGRPLPRLQQYRMPALAGDIRTRDGKILATSQNRIDLVLSWPRPGEAPTLEEVAAQVRSKLDKAAAWLDTKIELPADEIIRLYHDQRMHPLPVWRGLTEKQAAAFHQSDLADEGLALQETPTRVYPHGSAAAHAIGYMKLVESRPEVPALANAVLYDDLEGAAGLERAFGPQLKGIEGLLHLVTDSDGFARDAQVIRPTTKGRHLETSIDMAVQSVAEKAMADVQRGALVVMDVTNGDVVACVSRPAFDPNDLVPPVSLKAWQRYNADGSSALLNHALHVEMPPGSVFKVVTTLASMRARVFDPHRGVRMTGSVTIGNVTFDLAREVGYARFADGLAHSYNTYFIDLGLRTGRDALIETARLLGLGQSCGTVLADEDGFIPDPQWVLRAHRREMGPGDVANTSIGQGDVLVTPLQAANLMATVANRGRMVKPRFAVALLNEDGSVAESFDPPTRSALSLSPAGWETLEAAMVDVTESGTGRAARTPGIIVAAKTGTAQIGPAHARRNIAWTAGFAPADGPRYAFCVMVEGRPHHELSSSRDAAPVVGQLLRDILPSG